MSSKYAAGTTVEVGRSRDEIDRIFDRFGAKQRIWGRDDERGTVTVAFARKGVSYRFTLALPKLKDFEFTPTGKRRTSQTAIKDARDQEERRCFRSLANYLKGMLDAADTGFLNLDEALLPYAMLGSGQTVAQNVLPQMSNMLESGRSPDITRALLPSGS